VFGGVSLCCVWDRLVWVGGVNVCCVWQRLGGFGGVSLCCVWDRLVRCWGSEFVLCVGENGVGLGE